MLSSIFVSYLPYALVTSFTPGPNNVLALHTVSQNGWARGKNTVLGIIAGFFCVMAVCALFRYQLNHFLPTLSQALRYVGAGYILWLAVHVARSKPAGEESRKASFWKGFLLQFVNVKNHPRRHHHLHRLRLSCRGQRHHGGTTPAADLGGHRRVYDLGRGGRAVPGLPHQALPALQLRHGGGAGPLRRGHGGLRGRAGHTGISPKFHQNQMEGGCRVFYNGGGSIIPSDLGKAGIPPWKKPMYWTPASSSRLLTP